MQYSFGELIDILKTPPYLQLLIVAMVVFTVGIIGRILCGKSPEEDKTRTAAVCYLVIFLYIVSIVLFREDSHLQIFASALPFFERLSDSIPIYRSVMTDFSGFLVELAQLFLVTICISSMQMTFEHFGVKRESLFKIERQVIAFFKWYFVECIILLAAMGINVVINKALENMLGESFAKFVVVAFFVLVGVSLLLSFFRLILGAVGFLAKPIIDIIKGFLFANFFGKIITKSFRTTIIITLVILVLNHFGHLAPIMSVAVPATVFMPVLILIIAVFYITCVFL